MNENVVNLEIFNEVKKTFPEASQDQLKKIASTIPLFISVAAQDKVLKKEEMSYLKRYARKLLEIEKEQADHIIRYFLLTYKSDEGFRKSMSQLVDTLNTDLTESEKTEFIGTLLAISRSDLEICEKEKSHISKIAERLGLSKEIFHEELLNASLLMTKKIFSDLETDSSLKTSDDEVKQYEIMSARDYYVMMNNPK